MSYISRYNPIHNEPDIELQSKSLFLFVMASRQTYTIKQLDLSLSQIIGSTLTSYGLHESPNR